eukprot:3423319-Pleurochrysis_carterae.AAC.1
MPGKRWQADARALQQPPASSSFKHTFRSDLVTPRARRPVCLTFTSSSVALKETLCRALVLPSCFSALLCGTSSQRGAPRQYDDGDVLDSARPWGVITLQSPLKAERGPIRSSDRTFKDHARLSWRRPSGPGRNRLVIHDTTTQGGRGAGTGAGVGHLWGGSGVVAQSGCVGHARYGVLELEERSASAPQ